MTLRNGPTPPFVASTRTQSVTIGRIETVALPGCGFEELQRVEALTHETARRVPRRPEQVMADLVRQSAPERTRDQQVVPFRQGWERWNPGYQCRVTPCLCDPHSCHADPARCIGQMECC